MADIHPTSVVDPRAKLADSVKIGPFCVVGPEVELGEDVVLRSHVVLDGNTQVGAGTEIYPFASIGLAPQDLKYRGEKTRLEIGARNKIREYVTMNPGTEGGGSLTKVGDDCLFMVGSHVAHDCIVGHHVILANNATLAGHVVLGDFAIVGGLSAVHQFVRIGPHAMIGGMSGVEHDVIPYGSVMGDRASLCGLNIVGLKRRGFDKETIHRMRSAYRMLFADEGTIKERVADVDEVFGTEEAVRQILEFVRVQSSRGLTQPRSLGAGE
ncbi:MAG: acyl-ACP--UDP-N-acetylglucosamine O-acyltransferase [Alphaproteobacteria bacterium]|jgi:UDP-N-acetylglucosamine acyltransferase|nr:acyl-ACP--UDP-N-acetylglucosamine O-acyltransferase [Pseudomonadota bacterium]